MSKKVIIIIIAVVMLFMGMMGAGFFVLWNKMSTAVAQVQAGSGDDEAEEVEEELEENTLGTIYKLDTMIVNLADKGGKRYLRITMELELNVPTLLEEIDMRLPQLRDSILMILPTKTYDDIGTTEGKIALRDELITRLNSFLKTGQITTIYFSEFVVQ